MNHQRPSISRVSALRLAVSWRQKQFSAIRPIGVGHQHVRSTTCPFPGTRAGQTTEFNASARQSRLSIDRPRADSPPSSSPGYAETDFLGAGITSNNNESNSYVPRLRPGMGPSQVRQWLELHGRPDVELVTENKHGVDNRIRRKNRREVPLTIDPQYTAGFSWARQEGFRVAYSFADKFTVAASVEGSATTATVHGNPTITDLSFTNGNQSGVTTPTLTTTTLNNFLIGAPGLSSGLYNPTGTYAYNKLPDFVFKAAFDPGPWGHFEVFGLVSEFRDRAYPCYYANGGFNDGATPNLRFPDHS